MITESIEIDRPPAEVFAYLDQLDRHPEWQTSLVSTRIETEGPPRVGTRVVDRRKVPGGEREIPYEVTEHDPPHRSSFRGTSGPVRCIRFCRAPKSGRPWSSIATISPSTTASCPMSAAGSRATSG